jgi:A/G-specific adenine glycosylase
MAFAHKEKSLVLDVNIRRLFTRALDGQELPPLHITNTERQARTELIPEEASRWAAATMELGALVCTATKPLCERCPIANQCLWRANGFPKSETKKKPTQKWHGTDRQCRGTIIEHLRTNENSTTKNLQKLWQDHYQLEKCVTSLIKDCLIKKNKENYSLVD